MKTVWVGLESLHEDSHLTSYDGPERHDRLLLKTLLDELAMLREPVAVRHDDEMPLPSIPDEELSASTLMNTFLDGTSGAHTSFRNAKLGRSE